MTGFGRAVCQRGTGRFTAEIRSVNGRFLKLGVKVPLGYGALEDRVKVLLAEEGLCRGSVDVGLFFDGSESESSRYRLDAEALRRYAKEARAVAKGFSAQAEVPWAALFALPGVVRRTEGQADVEAAWTNCARALRLALRQLNQMREREGAALSADVRRCLAELRRHREALAQSAPAVLEKNIARFKERVERLLEKAGVKGALPGETLEREIVLASDRTDIGEELARLESHFVQMEAALDAGGEAGKRLDFLTQELLRETNTIGSKASDEAITHRVVEMKNLIEQIREQVQNME